MSYAKSKKISLDEIPVINISALRSSNIREFEKVNHCNHEVRIRV